MRPGSYIASQVYPPEPFAAEFQTVDEDAAGVSCMGVVVGVRRIPLEEDLVLSVTIGIANRAVAGAVSGYLTVRHNLVCGSLQGYGYIVFVVPGFESPAALGGLRRTGPYGIYGI